MTKRFELRLCSNGTYYVYENGALTDVDFDKFNKESAYALIDKVNALYEEKEKLKIFLEALNEELSLANRDNDTLAEENEQLRKENDMFSCELSVSANKEISRNCRIAELEEENKALQKKLHLIHMSSMFSTVKSFKGDISKRYKYSEKTDMIYDTANHYGEYNKVLDKKEITMLLNEYNTLLEESNEE